MLIQGVSFESNHQLEELQKLPSSFPDYNENRPLNYYATREAYDLNLKGVELFRKGDYDKAKQQFQNALENNQKSGNTQEDNIFMAQYYTNMGHVYSAEGQYNQANECYEKSVNIFMNNNLYETVEENYKSLAATHKQLGTIRALEQRQQNLLASTDRVDQLQANLALGAIARIENRAQKAIGYYADAYSYRQGRVDYDAHRIEQHEVGFSAEEKIGTDNIQQCVVMIIRDPNSRKTALAHIDKNTDATSIVKVMDKFSPDANLEVYLIGGRDRSGAQKSVSDNNIKKITEQLSNYSNVDIKSADVGDKGSPSAIVFDPKTGKLTHAVPGKNDPTTPIRMATIGITEGQTQNKEGLSPLIHAFDYTESKIIPPKQLSKEQQTQVIQSYLMYKDNPMQGTSEMWQANIISAPYRQATDDLIQKNPTLKSAIEQDIRKQIDTLVDNKLAGKNVNPNKKAKFVEQLTTDTKTAFQEDKITIHNMKDSIQNTINQSITQKTLMQRVFNPKNWLNLLKTFFTGKPHMSINTRSAQKNNIDLNNNKPENNAKVTDNKIANLSQDDKLKLNAAIKDARLSQEINYLGGETKSSVAPTNNKGQQTKKTEITK